MSEIAPGDVAVIGMAGRFPGAGDVARFWENLRAGVESIARFSDDELLAEGVPASLLRSPGYVKAGAVIEGVEDFDARFFGFQRREAEWMDPQHRHFLECAWEALEDAGYDPSACKGSVGVFASADANTYLLRLWSVPRDAWPNRFQMLVGNEKDYVATRVSYKLGLRGPSVSVQTACSSSLVAVHLACQSILAGECDMALAGGVSIGVPQRCGYVHEPGGIESPDGHCRAFDADARGTVGGNGVGIVVLKRLAQAWKDGDTVRAVVKGSAINNDGSGKVGFTAPSVEGQAAVIAEALSVAGVEPDTIRFVEAHGTATELGDRIEVAALARGLGGARPCALGALKTNIGHLGAAAGVAGLIKAVLSLQHRTIPATLHFKRPNPELALDSTRFFVNATAAPWAADDGAPRRAGVSSFGIGGTNAHVVLEEPPARPPRGPSRPWKLLVLSAATESALERSLDRLATHLPGCVELEDVAYTLQAGRRRFEHRAALVARDPRDAAEALRARDPGRVRRKHEAGVDRAVAFVLPASIDAGTGAELLRTERFFGEQVARCCDPLRSVLGLDLLARLREGAPFEPGAGAGADADADADADVAALVLGCSLARLWMHWGVRPRALLGNGVGELTAACVAGTLSIEHAAELLLARARGSDAWRARVECRAPRIPLMAGSGEWVTPEQAVDPQHWASFAERAASPGSAVERLQAQAPWLVFEPAACLRGRHAGGEQAAVLDALGDVWLSGGAIDWCAVQDGFDALRMPLPTYPFERERYWVDVPAARAEGAENTAGAEDTERAAVLAGAEIETELRALFADAAGLTPEEIDPDATFHELGFDSLAFMQAVASLRKRFGIDVAFRELYDTWPTVRRLAAHLDGSLARGMAARAPVDRAAEAPREQPVDRAVAPIARADRGAAPIARADRGAAPLDPQQRAHVDALVRRYTARTAGSKRVAQTNRRVLADNRASARFDARWKELVYPIVGRRASGARTWDVDDNEYVDLTMGFGVSLFGHAPELVTSALAAQLAAGFQLGPQSERAGRVAELLCELTGSERVLFSNSGTEAVMAALRVARAVTGRRKIVCFSGSYHGSFDGVLARRGPDPGGAAVPAAPGVPPSLVGDVVMLEYGEGDALEIIRRDAREIAAVLVEPVQSRRPELQPRAFLRELRAVTAEAGAALIFDEVITGLRAHPRGAQGLFGVDADLTIYGKVLGGGMPIGVVAGRAAYLDAIDGGAWSYGDDSAPTVPQTFFAGTFCKHPLALCAAEAVASHLLREGPELQRLLNARTRDLIDRLNGIFRRHAVEVRAVHFASQFVFRFPAHAPFMDLFYYHLIARGVYVWEGGTCFLSTAHGDADLEHVARAVEETVIEMLHAGVMMPVPARRVPLTDGQQQIWLQRSIDPESASAYAECSILRLRGPLHTGALRRAIDALVESHEALRSTFAADGSCQIVQPFVAVDLTIEDLRSLGAEERGRRLSELSDRLARTPFDVVRGPLLRAQLVRSGEQEHHLLFAIDHLVCDGWSLAVVLRQLGELYTNALDGSAALSRPCTPFREFVSWCGERLAGAAGERAAAHWLDRVSGVPALDFPRDRARPPAKTYRGVRRRARVEAALYQAISRLAAKAGCSSFTVLLAAYSALLHRWTGSARLIVGISAAGQAAMGRDDLVGFCVSVLPIVSAAEPETSFAAHVEAIKARVIEAQEHPSLPVSTLLQRLRLPRDPSRLPLVNTIFNFDRIAPNVELRDVIVESDGLETPFTRWDVGFNLSEDGGELVVDATFNADLFDASTMAFRVAEYEALLREVAGAPERSLAQLWRASSGHEEQARRASSASLLSAARRKTVSLASDDLVTVEPLDERGLPSVVRPRVDHLQLAAWAAGKREWLEGLLWRSGALLFRGFAIDGPEGLGRLAAGVSRELLAYQDGTSPRRRVVPGVYTSTEYPAEQRIFPHNELSYAHRWPSKVLFHCVQPARDGGETPLVDCRRVFERIPSPIRDELIARRLLYVRNFNGRFGRTWQEAFETDDRATVEELCRRGGAEWQWRADGKELQTRQIRPAASRHPRTGAPVWFNHAAFFHDALQACPDELRRDPELVPVRAFYGDGGEIPDPVMEVVRRAYQEERVVFRWEASDVLLIDNLAVGHGREPFSGDRKVLVAMVDPMTHEECALE